MHVRFFVNSSYTLKILPCLNKCSMFNVQCSMFNVQCSMFNVQCSMFNEQCSMFNVQCSMNIVNVWPKGFCTWSV
jgi:hypothetical protein